MLGAVLVKYAGPGFPSDEYAGAGVPWLFAKPDAGIQLTLRGPCQVDGGRSEHPDLLCVLGETFGERSRCGQHHQQNACLKPGVTTTKRWTGTTNLWSPREWSGRAIWCASRAEFLGAVRVLTYLRRARPAALSEP